MSFGDEAVRNRGQDIDTASPLTVPPPHLQIVELFAAFGRK